MKRLFTLLLISFAALSCEMIDEKLDELLGGNKENNENNGVVSDIPNNQIWYTSVNGEIVEPYSGENNNYADALTTFGVNIVSNTYVDGKGIIEFEGDVTTIGEAAFWECNSLTSITIPDSVTTIGNYAFCDCYSLTSITIGNSVTTIGNFAFASCSSLTSVTIPNSVTTIENAAFSSCDSLASVTIPDSVTTIGYGAFWNCYSLASVTIGNSVTSIGDEAFENCSSLTSVTIPDCVTAIGDYTFRGCSSLQEFNGKFASEDGRCLIIDGTLNSFAPAGLTEYTIPNSVTSIGNSAFEDCSSLTSVTIGDSVTTIGEAAFVGCSSLQEFKSKFASEDGRCLIIDGTLNSFAPAGLTEYTIPDSVTTIGNLAFAYCYDLTSVTIPDSVTMIGDYAFCRCSSLASVTIPDNVTTIGDGVFYECSSLTSVTIPDSVTTIGDQAFIGCESLTSVIIGDSVTTIGNYAFSWCESLTSVYCKATTPPAVTLGYYDWCAFDGNSSGRKIYVPMESVEAYKSVSGWSKYASAIVGYYF